MRPNCAHKSFYALISLHHFYAIVNTIKVFFCLFEEFFLSAEHTFTRRIGLFIQICAISAKKYGGGNAYARQTERLFYPQKKAQNAVGGRIYGGQLNLRTCFTHGRNGN